ncbi:MAG: 4-(cytidine 5'-diphospho)-2-C-methyl-D-erythritol kinase [Chloroflexi bacterium]|nr:4-(cytidine 5'-diphospho)-2-C-methyl-D-erythritol kinase [Chloroflexota bacterium]
MRLNAHAKVNLTLEIIGKRPDGFHNLASVMQTIELHDEIDIESSDDLSLECDVPELNTDSNLVLVAARALREVAGVSDGAHITVRKSIPEAAGLGGGSADAAAALHGLNDLWDAGLDARELASLGITLGSDIPFLLRGGTALVQGRGEDVTPLPNADIGWMVLLTPDIKLDNKTGALFSRISPADHTRGTLTHKLAGRIRGGGDVPPQFFFNVFDRVADDAFPCMGDYRTGFASVGAPEIILSGAGPTLFAIPDSRELGVAWELLLKSRGWNAVLTRAWWPENSG